MLCSYPYRIRFSNLLLAMFVLLLLSACGFQLRQTGALPFNSIYLGFAPNSEMGATLKRQIEATSHTKVVNSMKEAEVQFVVLEDRTFTEDLSLDASGRVRDINLFYRFSFQVLHKNGSVLLPPSTFTVRREMTNNDAQLIAKEFESQTLFNEMASEIAQKVLRRLHSLAQQPLSTIP